MESFSEKTQLAKHAAGIKGGPFFKNPLTPQPMSIVEGWPPEVREKLMAPTDIQQGPVLDPWVQRRSK